MKNNSVGIRVGVIVMVACSILTMVNMVISQDGTQNQSPETIGAITWNWNEAGLRWTAAHPVDNKAEWWIVMGLKDDQTPSYTVQRMKQDDTGVWVLDDQWHDGVISDIDIFNQEKYAKSYVAGEVIMEASFAADNQSNADRVLNDFGVIGQ